MSDGHRIAIRPSTARVEVVVGGAVVATSERATRLDETGLPPRWYLPRDDVRTDLLEPTSTTSTCPFKGRASYWSVRAGDRVFPDVVWCYEDPIPDAAGIAGLLAFWEGKPGVEVRVTEPAPGSAES